jgi:hypothetical protein
MWFIIIYYLAYGAATAFYMNKVGPLHWPLMVIVVIGWPLMLPLSALLVFLVEREADKLNK